MKEIPQEPPGFDELEPEGQSASRPEDREAIPLGSIESDEIDGSYPGWSIDADPGTERVVQRRRDSYGEGAAGEWTRKQLRGPEPLSAVENQSEDEGEWLREAHVRKPSQDLFSPALKEQLALGKALARAASRTNRVSHAVAYIAASVPLALHRHPEYHAALVQILPGFLQASARLVQTWYGEPSGRSRLRSFPNLLDAAIQELIAVHSGGQRVTPAMAAQTLLEMAHSGPASA